MFTTERNRSPYLACARKNWPLANDALKTPVVSPTVSAGREKVPDGQVWPPPSICRSTTSVPPAHPTAVKRFTDVPSPLAGRTSSSGAFVQNRCRATATPWQALPRCR